MYKVLLLEKFNNYFNRIIKGYTSIGDYINAVENFYLYDKEINFSFADNVSTELIMNECPFEPDYLLLLDENAQNIISRWFVIEGTYTRKGQKNFKLKRDVIYDHIEKLLNSPVYIHKAWLHDEDPFILNDEGMSFNEIKTEETLLKDSTGSAWIVGYIAKNVGSEHIELQLAPETTPKYTTLSTIAAEMGITEAKLSGILNSETETTIPAYFTYGVMVKYRGKVSDFYFLIDGWEQTFAADFSKETNRNNFIDSGSMKLLYVGFPESFTPPESIKECIIAQREGIMAGMESIFNRPYFTNTQLNILKKYANNNTLILQAGVYYNLNIVVSGNQVNRAGPAVYSSFPGLSSAIYNAWQNPKLQPYSSLKNNGEIFVDNKSTMCYIQLKPATIGTNVPTLKTDISASRKVLFDNTFDMFAIPFGEINVKKTGDPDFKTDPLVAKKIAIEIAKELSSSCYDIQLLPYAPFESIMGEGSIDITNLTEDEDYTYIKAVDENNVETNISVILWAQTNTFSLNLPYSLSLKNEVKIESQCNKYRLCSPNYQGSFDFNVAKNGGSVAYFIAECTYKPYTPYMKIVPQMAWMYGTNFGDARGLICGGDFSTPRLTDAWEEYELNNKNYQNIFNRDIQHLDFEHSVEHRQAMVSGIAGIFTGGAAGAGTGAFLGGGWGALVGGIVGTGASGVGMGFDMYYLAQQQRENKQYAIDKYNFQLGNIKALPYTLTKVGAFNINSKIWPFIEYYTCTEEEKEALRNKLKYESMTVMRIGLLGDYYNKFEEPHYFKGELIRNEQLADDTHVFEAIYAEILKGVYI